MSKDTIPENGNIQILEDVELGILESFERLTWGLLGAGCTQETR